MRLPETARSRKPFCAWVSHGAAPYRVRRAGPPVRTVPILATVSAQWTIADAWVFASIEGIGAEDGYTLAQIIAKADGINHAVPTEAEFTRAVSRLVAAGLIGARAETDRYWHTAAGRALYRQRMKRRGLFGWIDAIPPALRGLGEPRDTAWSLPPGVFDHATRRYLRRAVTRGAGKDRVTRCRRARRVIWRSVR